jgi:glycosyltransferase involved in cell wall biosynthesis
MKVMVLGVRGIPAVQGGVETHAEQLYPRLARLGCDIEIITRSPFVPRTVSRLGSVRLKRLWAPTTRGFEAFVHSVLGVLYAAWARPDVLHIHAVGPSIVTPLARAFGLRVVVTNHGPDYERDKWGTLPKWVLRTGERLGMKFADSRIAISGVIQELIRNKYARDSYLIPNGSVSASPRTDFSEITRFGLDPQRYFLQVSRLVPEKRQLDLIRAFDLARPAGWKLALVGSGGQDSYSDAVRNAARAADVVLTGFQSGETLAQLYSHAGVFVLPSSHEGLPIAILEALSYGLPIIASDIRANQEINLGAESYFPTGDVAALADRLTQAARTPQNEASRAARRQWVAQAYDWDRIARQTLEVYRRVLGMQNQTPLEPKEQKA